MKYLYKTNWRFYDLLALLIIVIALFRYSANARSMSIRSAIISDASSMLKMRTTTGRIAAGTCYFLPVNEKIKIESTHFYKIETE